MVNQPAFDVDEKSDDYWWVAFMFLYRENSGINPV
jgi:hypothetical protein